MKEEIKQLIKPAKGLGGTRTFLVHFLSAVGGLLATRVQLMSALSPLGIILAAAVPMGQSLSVGLGSFLGYLFFSAVPDPFRYTAALFATISLRMLSASFKKISDQPFFCAFSVLVSLTVCNLVACMQSGSEILLLLSEGVLGGGLTYFVRRALSTNIFSGIGLNGEELTSVVITLDLVLIALVPLNIFGFSIGRTLTVALIISASRFGGVTGGAVCGTAVGFAAALSAGDPKVVCLYAVSGMLSGLFSAGGRVTGILGFCVPAFICLGLFGIDSATLYSIIEILLGTAIFLIIPKNLCLLLASFFAPPVRLESLEGMRQSLVMRLKYASGALCDVSGTIEEVAKRLKKINLPDPSDIFSRCEREACKGCSFRINCWETDRQETLSALGILSKGIREGDRDFQSLTPEFYGKCLRREKLYNSLQKNYSEYLSQLRAEERIIEVRGVVADQFDGISDMLLDLAEEFNSSQSYDLDTAQTIVSALREIGLLTSDCSCSVDKYGRMTIELKIHNYEDKTLNRRRMLEQLEAACERRFEPPNAQKIDDIIYVTVKERAAFQPEVGIAQIPASGEICGDSYSSFGDGFGRYFLLLSDGMGTGGRAAVDGAMTAGLMERLLKAGFGFDCSLRIVNSALLYKSTDESLSTVDIACIDLYTGETELYKAGAAPTLVRRNGKVGKAESHSLPVGILRDVGFDRSAITLKFEDVVVILSDGATTEGTEWICKEIEAFQDSTAQDLADKIADSAARRADKNHPDDITVMVAFIQRNL